MFGVEPKGKNVRHLDMDRMITSKDNFKGLKLYINVILFEVGIILLVL